MNFEDKFCEGGSHIMNMQLVQEITKKQLRNDIPDFKPGDTLKVSEIPPPFLAIQTPSNN